MSPLGLAWRGLVRQPARAFLGVAGIAVVGALLFDMLLLSRGLAVSFRDLLEGMGFDVRVTAGQFVPSRGPRIAHGPEVLARIRALPEISEASALRFGRAGVVLDHGEEVRANFMGLDGPARRIWTVLEGANLPVASDPADPVLLVNRALAERAGVGAGDFLRLRGACEPGRAARPPTLFRVAGVVEFRFDVAGDFTTVTTAPHLVRTCDPDDPDGVTLFLASSRRESGPDAAVRAIDRVLPDLHAYTNRELVDRLQVTDFSYFRQIAFALSCITLFFAFLLVATLITVSVNQRLGEVAALRALGFRRRRIVAQLLWESCLLVGCGGLIALPLGGLVALRLDAILREMPGIPMNLHFFVFGPHAVLTHAVLLVATGLLASVYPVLLAARLPITATLRREIVS